MKNLILEELCPIIEKDNFADDYYIAHLLDRVLLGKRNDNNYSTLINAVDSGELLELHLFNKEREIFISRVDGEYVLYKPLLHCESTEEKPVITRYYEIMSGLQTNLKNKYKALEVKEYISYDEESNLAYVEKTVLHSLLKEVDNV